ncbi:hypothetical protein HY947_01200 [Candidatus Gottesmanbacteria bacterium]|nr:hypothetical protein [Candidatus Gottesmanbacteria bacterium]
MNKTDIEKIIRNEPLFEGNISMKNIWNENISTRNLMVGAGFCTSSMTSQGIPFDILSFFLIPELLRREGIIHNTIFLIADSHAETNTFMSHFQVMKLSHKMESTAFSIIRNLRLKNFHVVRATAIRKESSFQDTLSSIPHMENQYLREEVSDLLWMNRHKDVGWKLGWTMSNSDIPLGHDERFFDIEAKQICGNTMNFLYISAGRTFATVKPKASPYISTANADRIVLSGDENVKAKIESADNKNEHVIAAMNHLERIIRLFEKLIIRIPAQTLEEKIEFILAITTQDI